MFKRKGQSTLEYIVVFTAIVSAIIIGAGLYINYQGSGAGLGRLMMKAGNKITTATGNITTDLNP